VLRSARLTLKQHRFEVGAGALAAVLLGVAALWVNSKLRGLNVPPACFEAWLGSAGQVSPDCERLVQAFAIINEEEAGKVFAAMAVLPIAIGLLGGVTLVGRELESRTAQTAWALAASRRLWLARQLWPVVLVIAVTVAFAAFAVSALEATRATFSTYVWMDHGLYGPLVVARAFGALGLGLLAGAAVGRTLPAFVLAAVLSVVLVAIGASGARAWWVNAQPRVEVSGRSVEEGQGFDGILFDQAYRAPDGSLVSMSDAYALVPVDGSTDPYEWLLGQGYTVVEFGITGETARGWEPLEIAGTALIGLAFVLGTVVIVDRRRPS
jgi:hypothetical protein